VGLAGLFWFTALLAGGGMLVLALVVPTPDHSSVHRDAEAVAGQFRGVLRNTELLRLDYGILTLHMVMTAIFLAVPLTLKADGLPAVHHWWVYLPVMLLSVVAMVPFIIQAESRGRMRPVFVGAVLTLAVALLGLYGFHERIATIAFFLFLFFTGFNLLEAAMPSLIAKMAPAAAKGTAMGVFSTSQFTGAFLGGALGGWVHQHFGEAGVFLFCAGAALIWFLVARTMARPRQARSQVVRLGPLEGVDLPALQRRLLEVPGVEEAEVVGEEGLAYLKVDSARLDSARLQAIAAGA
jgi:predicted MFS family arabinose efflux permease